MEGQELTEKSKVFQIPIEDFEDDMNTESAKEKKKEILDLLTNNNFLSKEDFFEVEDDLHDVCMEGDLEMIKILLNETIEDSTNTFIFKIDKTNQTASLFRIERKVEEVNIPRIVEHESTEYFITSIIGTCRNIKTIKFCKDSAVKTFYKNAFSKSKIEEIYFPDSLKELKEGWCHGTRILKRIIISPSNGQFEIKDDKYLICKNESNNDENDKLLFVRRDIEEFSIPSNITIISSCAFDSSKIKSIFITSKISKICDFAFSKCTNLKKVEIPTNSNLQIIEQCAFYKSKIKSIFIPSKVSKIGEHAFSGCENLTKVEIPLDSNLQTIELDLFSFSNIESILIPSNISKICNYAFAFCYNLKKVEIPTNSNLQAIEECAFYNSNIESIFIPSKVSEIGKYVFKYCENLQIIEISEKSELKSLPLAVFEKCPQVIIIMPSSLRKLE